MLKPFNVIFDHNYDGFDQIQGTSAPVISGNFMHSGIPSILRWPVEFDLSILPTDATINSASLRIFHDQCLVCGTNFEMHGYVGNGTEELNDATEVGNLLATFTNKAQGTFESFDISNFVISNFLASNQYVGVVFRAQAEGPSAPFGPAAILGGGPNDVSIRPTITIDYDVTALPEPDPEQEPDPAPPGVVPVPAALPLFATGLGVLGFFGWRKQKSKINKHKQSA